MRPSARIALVLVLATAIAACTGSVGGSGVPASASASASASAVPSASAAPASPSAVPSGSASSSTGPSSTADAAGPWLRAWFTQALSPLDVFGLTDALVITAGGMAVTSTPIPTVFPGPAVVPLGGRQLTQTGLDRILARAKALGLVGATTDFGAPDLPGAATAHLALTIDGRTVEITGDANRHIECIKAPCDAAPGSPEAFGQFWQELSNLDWLGADVAAQGPYAPPVYSVLVGQAPTPDAMLGANLAVWPLDTPLATFGAPVANGTARCGTVSGHDADLLRAALAKANGQSQWVQNATTNATFGLTVRPLADGQDACREVFGVG